MSDNMIEFARRELEIAGAFDEEADYGGSLGKDVLEILEVFARQGHSGGSAYLAADLFGRLVKNLPLSPLTGKDDEWVPIEHDRLQNKRCFRVIKTPEGDAYDTEGKVFEDPDECRFTNSDSFVKIAFPYTPKTEVVKVDCDGNPIG